MYLKKLELNGFKSFAQPVSLEFSSGITAIVGPNGSGKSNISDAIRWILGEQSMKNIRSQSSKDLIFSGSKTRNRLGRAGVSLHFDNSSGRIPLDYSEVAVSRNIFRDGTSEYYINKNEARLIDVVEILAKANVGHRGFSVINQGMESEILKYSPSELYELLEEASGVRYLQLKKRRSERRLRTTRVNLDKASSILREITPHLKYLQKEATKAERKEKLKEKLFEFREQFFFAKIADLEKQKKDLDNKKELLETKISGSKKEVLWLEEKLKQEETTIKESRERLTNLQKELEQIWEEKTKISEELASLQTKIQIEAARPKDKDKKINIELAQIEDELEHIYLALKEILELEDMFKIKEKTSEALAGIEKIIGNRSVEEKLKTVGTKQLNKLLEEQKNLRDILAKINDKYENYKSALKTNQLKLGQEKFFELEKNLRKKKDGLADLESRLKEVSWFINQIEERFKDLKQLISREGRDYDEIKNKKDINQISDESLGQLEEKINRLKYQVEEIGGVDDLTLQEYRETKERYQQLSEKLDDLEKAKKDLEELIKQLTKEISGQFDKKFGIINDNFNKYFRLLFNGGRAYLKQISKIEQSREENQEESGTEDGIGLEEEIEGEEKTISKGVEIIATLPGKKINDLRQFSGGEKALTSIALLFAIISSSPPPFLVLDEADATLDESNSQRFAKLLSEFSKDTQFIIITHNRETMNQADVLYGVTMGNDGISKLLSLKLEK